MKMKLGYLIVTMLIFAAKMDAQQIPIFTDIQANHNFSNPSFLSLNYLKYDRNMEASAIYRNQWIQAPDAPSSVFASFDFHNPNNRLTLGGNLISDKAGGFGNMGIRLKSSYLIPASDRIQVNVGLSAAVHQYRINATQLNFQEAGDIAQQR